MPFGIISAGVGAAGNILGGIFGGDAASKAAKQQQQAEGQARTVIQQGVDSGNQLIQGNQGSANNILSNVYGTNQGLYAPYQTAGSTAIGTLSSAIAPGGSLAQPFTAADMEQYDPGYQFRLQQGAQAVQRSAAASGSSLGGGTLKALTDYAQGAASSEYQNAFNRYITQQNQRYSELSGVANLGLNSTNSVANQGNIYAGTASNNLLNSAIAQGNRITTGAGQIAQTYVGAGNAAAAGTVGQANAYSGALGGLTNTITGALSNPAIQNYLGFGGGGGSGYGSGGTTVGTNNPGQTEG